MIESTKEKILFIHSEEVVGADQVLIDMTTETFGRRVRKRHFIYVGAWRVAKERGYL